MIVAFAVVLLQAAHAEPSTSAFGRDACASVVRDQNVWERVRAPELHKYCQKVANAAAKLAVVAAGRRAPAASPYAIADARGTLEAVKQSAEEAMALAPGRIEAPILRARALAELGDYRAASEAFAKLRGRGADYTADAPTLVASGRASLAVGDRASAVASYRAALPRAALLSNDDRSATYFEAGLLLQGEGAPLLDESLAVLREGRRIATDEWAEPIAVALALALSRGGDDAAAHEVLGSGVRAASIKETLARLAAREPGTLPVLRSEEDALVAEAEDITDPAAARLLWKQIAGRGGTWAAFARAKAEAPPPVARMLDAAAPRNGRR